MCGHAQGRKHRLWHSLCIGAHATLLSGALRPAAEIVGCAGLRRGLHDCAAQCQPFGFSKTSAGISGTCANLPGNAGRNSIIGPGLLDLDFSLFKNNHIPKISETFNIQFRAEFFNILNHSNFATPYDNETLFSVSGAPVKGAGALDTLVGTAREIQFGMKIIF
jgi:hypothetical protein